MCKYEQISPSFYGCDLLYGKLDIKPSHNFNCFFIVERVVNEEYIDKNALELILTHCTHFEFYGKYSQNWCSAFRHQNARVHPNCKSEERIVIVEHKSIGSFISSLKLDLSCRSIVPSDTILIYDNTEIYKTVLSLL